MECGLHMYGSWPHTRPYAAAANILMCTHAHIRRRVAHTPMHDPDAQEFQFMVPGKSFEKLLAPDLAQVTQHDPHVAFRKLVGGALSPAALGRLLPELQVGNSSVVPQIHTRVFAVSIEGSVHCTYCTSHATLWLLLCVHVGMMASIVRWEYAVPAGHS